jgi:hypothetical protein
MQSFTHLDHSSYFYTSFRGKMKCWLHDLLAVRWPPTEEAMKTLASLLITFLAYFACAQNPAFSQNPAMTPTAPLACGPMSEQFKLTIDQEVGKPQAQAAAGEAKIYIVEDQMSKAVRAVTIRMGIDGAWQGATRGPSYISFSVEPGEHHLCVDWISDWIPNGRLVSLYGLNAEAGKTYYFRARTIAGVASVNAQNNASGASLDLDLLNSDEGEYMVAHAALSNSQAKK